MRKRERKQVDTSEGDTNNDRKGKTKINGTKEVRSRKYFLPPFFLTLWIISTS